MIFYELRNRLSSCLDDYHCGYYIKKDSAILAILNKIQPIRFFPSQDTVFIGANDIQYTDDQIIKFKNTDDVSSFLSNNENDERKCIRCKDGDNYIITHITED